MSSESSMVGYYAARASEYERIYQKPERQQDLQRLSNHIEQIFNQARLFELACGTGYWTAIAARTAASIVAVDINEEVLAIARSKPIAPGLVAFHREDAYSLPRYPVRFTAGLAAFWWSHVPKSRLRTFLRGFHQLLSPGARIVFIDNLYVEGSSTPISRTGEEGDTYQSRRLADGSMHEVLKNFPTELELRAALDGLSDKVRVERLRYYWVLSYEPQPDASFS